MAGFREIVRLQWHATIGNAPLPFWHPLPRPTIHNHVYVSQRDNSSVAARLRCGTGAVRCGLGTSPVVSRFACFLAIGSPSPVLLPTGMYCAEYWQAGGCVRPGRQAGRQTSKQARESKQASQPASELLVPGWDFQRGGR